MATWLQHELASLEAFVDMTVKNCYTDMWHSMRAALVHLVGAWCPYYVDLDRLVRLGCS